MSTKLTWMPQEVKETSSVNLIGSWEAMVMLLWRRARVVLSMQRFPFGLVALQSGDYWH
jgi:hypothetical protein